MFASKRRGLSAVATIAIALVSMIPVAPALGAPLGLAGAIESVDHVVVDVTTRLGTVDSSALEEVLNSLGSIDTSGLDDTLNALGAIDASAALGLDGSVDAVLASTIAIVAELNAQALELQALINSL